MSSAAQHFRQSDLCKAIKAAAKAGLQVARVEISPDGRISIIAGKTEQEQNSGTVNEWDSVK